MASSNKERYESLKRRMKAASEKVAEGTRKIVTTGEVIIAASALGWLRGDYEGNGKKFEIGGDVAKNKAGVAPELVVAAPLLAIGLYLDDREGGRDVIALAQGASAAYGYHASYQAGFKRASDAAKTTTGGPRAMGAGASRNQLADAQGMIARARAARQNVGTY